MSVIDVRLSQSVEKRESGWDVLEEGVDVILDGTSITRACEEGVASRERHIGDSAFVICEDVHLFALDNVPESRRFVSGS